MAEFIVKNCPVKMAIVVHKDTNGETGKPDELKKKYGMTAEDIEAAVKKLIG